MTEPIPARYANDPRVRPDGEGGLIVRRDGEEFHLDHTDVFAWSIRSGRTLEPVMRGDGSGLCRGYATADQAVTAVLGTPSP